VITQQCWLEVIVIAQLFGWLGLVATALSLMAAVAVGLHYHPDSFGYEYVIASLAVIVLPSALFIIRSWRGPFSFGTAIFAAATGMILFFGGAFVTMGDPGDAMLFIGPMLLGLGLIALAFEGKPNAH
jgi:hypothetical protein